MAGHSKFKNIQHRKGAQDKRRARLFSRLAREITVAARSGLADPDANPRLRAAMQAARVDNMPKDNIDRALNRAQDPDAALYEEFRYEGFAPGGIGVIVEILTDNRNRAASGIRMILAKNGGQLVETGAVGHMFRRLGVIDYAPDAGEAQQMIEAALECGADDCVSDSRRHRFLCPVEMVHRLAAALETYLGMAGRVALIQHPDLTLTPDMAHRDALVKLLSLLNDHDDVQNVYTNIDPSLGIDDDLTAP